MSVRIWRDRLRRWSERRAGVDFSNIVMPEEVGLDPARAVCSAPSGSKFLRRVLKDLDISGDDRIVDIGCGKGSAMRVMLEFPFSRVDGIEAAPQIAAIARANFATLKLAPSRYRIIVADAAQFTALDEYNHVYLYNPFSCEVMASFMGHLAASIGSKPRHVTIVYDNPLCHDAIVAGGIFQKLDREYVDHSGAPMYVYTTRGVEVAA